MNYDMVALNDYMKNQQNFLSELARFWSLQPSESKLEEIVIETETDDVYMSKPVYNEDDDIDTDSKACAEKAEKRKLKSLSTLCF